MASNLKLSNIVSEQAALDAGMAPIHTFKSESGTLIVKSFMFMNTGIVTTVVSFKATPDADEVVIAAYDFWKGNDYHEYIATLPVTNEKG